MGRTKTDNKSNCGAAGAKKSSACKKKGQSASSHSKDGFVRARGAPRRQRKPQQRKPRRQLEVTVIKDAKAAIIVRCINRKLSVIPFEEGRVESEQQQKTNRAQYEAARARGDEDYCADNWSFTVCSGTDYPIVAQQLYEQCFDTHNNGIDWDAKFPPVAGVWSNIKLRMTIGNSSQPRAHLNFESVFAKLALPFVPRKTGGECEIWRRPSHATKMQLVREALLMAQEALAVGAIVVNAEAVAAVVLPEFPAVIKKHLSLLGVGEKGDDDEEEEEMDDDDEDADDANGAAESDGEHSAGQETDEEVEEEDEEVMAAATATAAAASPVRATSAASTTQMHLPPSRSGSDGSSFLHAGLASPTQRLLDSPTKWYPLTLASPVMSTPPLDASSPRLSESPLPSLTFRFGCHSPMAFSAEHYSPIPA